MTGHRHVEHCMGTVFSFDLRNPGVSAEALRPVLARLHEIDVTYSPYRPDSEISRLRRGGLRPADLTPEVRRILDLCDELEETTRGCFSAYAGGVLDPCGVVKGWSIEQASAMLRAAGHRDHSVNGGGDLRLSGGPGPGLPWRIGLVDPWRPDEVRMVVTGRDMAVATSGTAERGAHILDPRTGRPAEGGLSTVTVVGPSLTMADAYATAAFVMGDDARDWIESLPGYEACAVTMDGRTWSTGGLRAGPEAAAPPSPPLATGHRAGARWEVVRGMPVRWEGHSVLTGRRPPRR